MLNVTDLSAHYGAIQALRRTSLAVEEGELVTVLGPNGAGKSTLLRAILGLHPPSAGEVTLDGQSLNGVSAAQVVSMGIGYVPEGRQTFPSLSVTDNLLLGAYARFSGSPLRLLSPLSAIRRDPFVNERLSFVYGAFPILEERGGQLAGSLSGGEQQMLAIGRALMPNPRLLVLDEPSIGLAPNLVADIFALLADFRQQGLTILLVEQDAHAALRLADRGYIMDTGRVVADGSPKDLLSSRQLRRAYLGAPA